MRRHVGIGVHRATLSGDIEIAHMTDNFFALVMLVVSGESIHANVLHICREALAEPEVVPPFHSHE